MFTHSILLSATQQQGVNWGSLIFIVVMIAGLFLIMILPQKKREKQMKQMLDSIKPGTRIRTIGGIYGTVLTVKEDLVTIASGPDEVKLVFVKGAIASIEEAEDEEASEKEEQTEAQTEAKTDEDKKD